MPDNPRTVYNTGLSWMLRGAQMVRSAARDGADVDENVKHKADIVLGHLPTGTIKTVDDLMIAHITEKPCTARDLAMRMGVPNARTMSAALGTLVRKGRIDCTQDGRWMVYHLPGVRMEEAA